MASGSREKFAIVTGAGTGIGKHAALALAREGYTVALAGRRKDLLEKTAAEAKGGRTLAVPTDVADPHPCRRCSSDGETFGRLDVLFNNAGTGAPAVPLEDLTFEQWQTRRRRQPDRRVPLHAGGVPVMKDQSPRGGRIINNGSISAHAPRPNSAALHGDQARDHRPHQVDVARRPQVRHRLRADRHRQRGDRDDRADEEGRAAGERTMIAVEPTMDVEHVARAVVYMASLPLDANVLFMTVMATDMPFVGRG